MTANFLRPLLTGLFLTSLAACSKKDDATSPSTNASYTFDGQSKQAQATQSASSSSGYDRITVTLTTTPQPSSGPETLYLSFWKQTGQPNSAYVLMPVGGMGLTQSTSYTMNILPANATTPTFTSSGGISSTFSGEVRSNTGTGTYTVNHTITAGTFTDVRP